MDLTRFETQLFFCTVRIQVQMTPTELSVGTGFLVQAPAGAGRHVILLISNKHVFVSQRHKALITLHKRDQTLAVTDHLQAKKPHQIELFWHFAEGCEVSVQGDTAVARHGAVQLTITMPGTDWRPLLVHGQTEPPLGWVSRRFDERQASPTVVWRGAITDSARLVSHLRVMFST